MQPTATLLFLEGPILTMDKARPTTDALAVVGNRIAAVGEEARRMEGPHTRVVRLGPRCLLPGFVDAHNHLVSYGLRLMRLDLSHVRSARELLDAVVERAGMTPADGWIVGHSWDETKWEDARLPTQEELDRAAGRRATLLARVDRHGGLVTSAALAAAGLDAARGPFVVEHEYAKVLALVQPTLGTMVKGIAAATRRAHELGVTSSHVICAGQDFAALQAAREAGTLGVRVSCFVEEPLLAAATELGARRGLGDPWIRFLGLKLYADGSFGSRTAAISFEYKDKPGERGMFMHPEGRLEALVKEAKARGLQVAVHAIGDRTARRVLSAFELAGVTPADRARIEHLELADDTDLARAARMGVVASVQPNFTGEWGHRGGMYEQRLGWEHARRLNRFGSFQAAGIPLAFGSDDMPLGPMYGLASALGAPEKEQRISVEDALRAYTAGAAWAGFAENEVGTLRPGMLADLVVLSADPRSAPDLGKLSVQMTVVDGRVVHEK